MPAFLVGHTGQHSTPTYPVIIPRDNAPVVRQRHQRLHVAEPPADHREVLPRLDVPHADRPVRARRHHAVAVRHDGHGTHHRRVAPQHPDAGARAGVPDADLLGCVRAHGQSTYVGTQASRRAGNTHTRMQTHRPVVAARDDEPSVGREFDAVHQLLVPVQPHGLWVCPCVEESGCCVPSWPCVDPLAEGGMVVCVPAAWQLPTATRRRMNPARPSYVRLLIVVEDETER